MRRAVKAISLLLAINLLRCGYAEYSAAPRFRPGKGPTDLEGPPCDVHADCLNSTSSASRCTAYPTEDGGDSSKRCLDAAAACDAVFDCGDHVCNTVPLGVSDGVVVSVRFECYERQVPTTGLTCAPG